MKGLSQRRTFSVPPGPARDRGSSIHLGTGLEQFLCEDLSRSPVGRRYALVTDQTVLDLHGRRLAQALRGAGIQVDEVAFEAGERNKNRTSLGSVIDRMVELGLGRDAAILALGGGVVGDLAGFAASIYHRGIPVIQIPTTLLAMVDSSIGGKTGLDLPGGKNLVGSFHPPAAIYSDLALLETLPLSELRVGLSEVIKHGVIADRELFGFLEGASAELLQQEHEALWRVVSRSIEIKLEAISEDVHEAGRRATLNFGHTVGHAVESVSGYRVNHGQAVAMGMVAEARLSGKRGLLAADEIRRLAGLLEAFGLPVEIPSALSKGAIWQACLKDKKTRGGQVHCVLLAGIGTVARRESDWTFPVAEQEMGEALGG